MHEIAEKKTNTLNGIYRGLVLDNNDPQKLGRIKVQVYPAFGEITQADGLPWAVPAFPISQGAGNDIGSFVVPRVNSFVFVFFEEGDIYQPVYFAEATTAKWGLPADRSQNVLKAVKDTVDEPAVPIALGGTWAEVFDTAEPLYPHNKVLKTISGIVIEIEDRVDNPQDIKIKIYHPSKSWLEWTNGGDMRVHLAGSEQEVVKGDKKEYVKGFLNLTVDGDVKLKIGGSEGKQVGGSITETVSGNITVTAGGVIIIQGTEVRINP